MKNVCKAQRVQLYQEHVCLKPARLSLATEMADDSSSVTIVTCRACSKNLRQAVSHTLE